jgi:hypothetical protein
MKRNMIRTVLAAAALSTVVAGPSTFAQSYGGGPAQPAAMARDMTIRCERLIPREIT